jgi:poly-gamma-glutamate synthesis protein (capsule biosynthesis protein)
MAVGAGLVTVAAAGGGAYLLRADDDSIATPVSSTTTTSTTTAPLPTTTTVPPPDPILGSGQPVTFAFGGDSHFEAHLASRLARDPNGVLSPIAPVLSAADVAVVNLETAVTERGTPLEKEFTFRAPGTALTALAAAGVDAASNANNHAIDFGDQGLADTLDIERFTGFPLIGIGANAPEAYAPYRTVVNGQRIAILAATDVLDGLVIGTWPATESRAGIASAKDPGPLLAAVSAARADSDTVVVFLHWGIEDEVCPTPRQQDLARQLADAGADIVVGSHSHRLQGAGRLGDAFVDYGLGNFIWYTETGPAGVTGVLRVTATGHRIDAYEWVPAVIEHGVPHPLPSEEAATAIADWNALRDCTDLTA